MIATHIDRNEHVLGEVFSCETVPRIRKCSSYAAGLFEYGTIFRHGAFRRLCIYTPSFSSMTELLATRKTSALRVFLTCARQETRDMLEKYEARAAIGKCYTLRSGYNMNYMFALTALLNRLQKYIDICLCCSGAELCYGLSAIGAMQDGWIAATSCLIRQQKYEVYEKLMEENTLRAKLIINGLVAKLGHDFELESLWLLAAERVHKRVELPRSDTTNERSIPSSQIKQIKEYLTKAAEYAKFEGTGQQAALDRLVARQFRRAAVCTFLERNHPHSYAAEIYQWAASYCYALASASNYCDLWQTAMESMWRAGDLIVAHTDESSAKNDLLITQTIAAAKQLAENAQQAPQLAVKVDELRSKVRLSKEAATNCKDPCIKPVLQLLVEKQEIMLSAREQYLNAVLLVENMTEAAKELQNVIRDAEAEASRLHLHIEDLRVLSQSVEIFRRKALESDQIAHRELAPLLRLCWAKAAEDANRVLQLEVRLFQDGNAMRRMMSSVNWRKNYDQAIHKYVRVAENVLCSAVEYLDKARGAEAGVKNGRDPREAQMWRKAAECLVQEAEQELGIKSAIITLSEQSNVPVDECTRDFASAAEYLYLAYKYTQPASVIACVNSSRISALCKRLATAQILRASTDRETWGDEFYEGHARHFISRFIALLTTSDSISTETALDFEQACEYHFRFLHAVYMNTSSVSLWEKAVRNYQDPEGKQAYPRHAAASAVYILAAEAKEQGRMQFAAACAHAGSKLMVPKSSYYITLARRIIVGVDNSFPSDTPVEIPSELLCLPVDDIDPTFQPLLEVHAAAYIIVSDCECQLAKVHPNESITSAWSDAHKAVLKLTSELAQHVDELQYYKRKHSTESDGLFAYFKATAECYYAVTKLCTAGQAQQLCDPAVDMCKLAERVIKNNPSQRGMVTTAIELYVSALQSHLAGDLELNTLWSTAAYKARCYLEQRGTDKYGIVESAFKHAELAAQAMAAQRKGLTKRFKMWNEAALCWQALEKSLRDAKDLRGCVNTTSQPSTQGLRREVDRLEALARSAHTVSVNTLEGEGEVQARE